MKINFKQSKFFTKAYKCVNVVRATKHISFNTHIGYYFASKARKQ